jgi:hypothetical protein
MDQHQELTDNEREYSLSVKIAVVVTLILALYETGVFFVRLFTAYTPVAWYAWLWTLPGSHVAVAMAKVWGMRPSLSLDVFQLFSNLMLGIAALLINLGWIAAILFCLSFIVGRSVYLVVRTLNQRTVS